MGQIKSATAVANFPGDIRDSIGIRLESKYGKFKTVKPVKKVDNKDDSQMEQTEEQEENGSNYSGIALLLI